MRESLPFQTEAQKLLRLVIHSLYSHRDVFLRELISNASDALDKRRFAALTNNAISSSDELGMWLKVDKEARTLTLSDNGIGMTRQEAVDNLGTIAKSGTEEFQKALAAQGGSGDLGLIGQFGVGFYASFMVADNVTVLTRKAGEDTATRWMSDGENGYTVEDASRSEAGTDITLHLKAADHDAGIDDFCDQHVLETLIKKHSDFVAYPIRMMWETSEPALDKEGKMIPGALPEITHEECILNSQKALWLRPESEITEDEYKEFYRHVSHDWGNPLHWLTTSMEGTMEARALLFIPERAQFDLFHRESAQRGLRLYIERVLIKEDCRELLPDYLRFVRGVVDAEGLSLNVSRELVQDDRQLRTIRKHLEKKILDGLKALRNKDREKYNKFWHEFGPAMKEALLSGIGDTSKILDLLVCKSTKEASTTLEEYIGRMKGDQEIIYAMAAPTAELAGKSPALEGFKAADIEVLLLDDRIDEVWLQQVLEFNGKEIRSAASETPPKSDAKSEQDETKDNETYKELLSKLRVALQDEVKDVRLSQRLVSSPACLVTDKGDLTPQMEMLMRQSGQAVPKIKRILEINPGHTILQRLSARPEGDVINYARGLYGQALLAGGGEIVDPVAMAEVMTALMGEALTQ